MEADSILKKKGLVSLLRYLYIQGRSLKKFSITYNEKVSLQVNYWPEFPSFIVLKIQDETIQVINHPRHIHVSFSNDLSEIIHQTIMKYKKLRLQEIGFFDEAKQRTVFKVQDEEVAEVDVQYFSGAFVVFVRGKVDKELAEVLNAGNVEEFKSRLEWKVITVQFESFCRAFGKQLVQEPLRFSRCLYLMNESHKKDNVVGYVELGSVLPTDAMGNLLLFALRIYKDPIYSELVAFNENKEEHVIRILEFDGGNLEAFVQRSVVDAGERMLLMRIPISLLAKPEYN